MSANEVLRKRARGVVLSVLNPRIKQSLHLGHEMKDGNPMRQSLGPLGKSATSVSPTHLKVGNSPRLRDKPKCCIFTKCVFSMCK